MPSPTYQDSYLGIDLGGTGIKGAVISSRGEIMFKRSVPTPVGEGRDGILRDLIALIAGLIADSDKKVKGIGIGSAGRIDPISGTIMAAANLPGCAGTRLVEIIQAEFGLPVKVDNDVNAAALGELSAGYLGSIQSFAFMALGTGVGGALINEGKLVYGQHGTAGEMGHMILRPGGKLCRCGQRGCLEQYVSGTALNQAARAIDENWDSHMLIKKCVEGHPEATKVIDRFVDDLASSLVTIYQLFNPGVIVLGGGLAESRSAWWNRLEERVRTLSPNKQISIRAAQAGTEAGMLGAASLLT